MRRTLAPSAVPRRGHVYGRLGGTAICAASTARDTNVAEFSWHTISTTAGGEWQVSLDLQATVRHLGLHRGIHKPQWPALYGWYRDHDHESYSHSRHATVTEIDIAGVTLKQNSLGRAVTGRCSVGMLTMPYKVLYLQNYMFLLVRQLCTEM